MSSFHWSFNLILLASTIVSLSAVRSAIAQQDRSQPTPVLDQSFGTWSQGNPAPSHFLATHSTLLRNNKIVTVGGSSYNCCFARGKEEAVVAAPANRNDFVIPKQCRMCCQEVTRSRIPLRPRSERLIQYRRGLRTILLSNRRTYGTQRNDSRCKQDQIETPVE